MDGTRLEGFNPKNSKDLITIPDSIHFDNESHKQEVQKILEKEIELGALRVGFFGSRIRGTHQPHASDTDVLVVNEKAGGKKIPYDERLGKVLYFGKEAGKPSVHVTRITTNMQRNRSNEKLQETLKSTVWVWRKQSK